MVMLTIINLYSLRLHLTTIYRYSRASLIQQLHGVSSDACTCAQHSPTLDIMEHIAMEVFYRESGTVYQKDFALEANGGTIVRSLTSDSSWLSEFIGDKPPELTIREGMQVGQCWMLRSASGQLGLSLSTPIHLTNITIIHIPPFMAFEEGQAPKEMILWGILDGTDNVRRHQTSNDTSFAQSNGPPVAGGYSYVQLARFTYNVLSKNRAQTFAIEPAIAKAGVDFGIVVLEVKSNWGARNTCLYRVQIHGEPVVYH
ncbi:hypothetical protein NM688_g4789 [Phlebia brevispora]|uniref:Uncharacterized protein n=1 Tax=Phlebia brevispora TaxID=194682 RepID=A0ACC1T245_9APHY|nr:hypothetical protein NM688_g4789 [Phlebia brevispora]